MNIETPTPGTGKGDVVQPGREPTPPEGQPNQPDREPAQVPPGSGGGPEEGDTDQRGLRDPDDVGQR